MLRDTITSEAIQQQKIICSCSDFHNLSYCKHQLLSKVDHKLLETPSRFLQEPLHMEEKERPEKRGPAISLDQDLQYYVLVSSA